MTIRTEEEKRKNIFQVIDKLEKQYGKGAVMSLDQSTNQDIEVISTGSLSLNIALGVGGLPRGRIVEVFGNEGSGKTTLSMHVMCEAQKKGGMVAIIDVENSFDKKYAEKLGINLKNLFISQPDNGEQALEIAEQLIRSGDIDVIVIDSVAALVPKAEIEGDMGDSKMGLQARLMSQALRKLTSCINKTKTVCIFINQLREKIGIVYGNPMTTTGGNALKFYASVRLDIAKKETIKNGEEIFGNRVKVKVAKNKVAPPFQICEFDIEFGKGISRTGEVLDYATELDIVKKAGTWYSYGEVKLGQGREAVKQLFEDNLDMLEEIEELILKKLKS